MHGMQVRREMELRYGATTPPPPTAGFYQTTHAVRERASCGAKLTRRRAEFCLAAPVYARIDHVLVCW